MTCAIKNTTNRDMSETGKIISDYFPYAKKEMGFDKPVTVIFKSDLTNAKNPLGKTAYYDPVNFKIVIYVDGRHPKDMARSFSHELVHHKQNCVGELEGVTGEQGYAQTDQGSHIEEEAYRIGNKCFRNWTDQLKKQINETTYYKRGDITMNEQILRKAIKKALLNSSALREKFNLTEAPEKSIEGSLEKDLKLKEAEKEEKKEEEETEDGKIEVETEVETDVEIKEENLDEEEDTIGEGEPLEEWYNSSLYNKLLKEYIKR